MKKQKLIAVTAVTLLLPCPLCGCGTPKLDAPHYGTYYLNGEQNNETEAVVLTESEFQFVNCDTDYYNSFLMRGLEGIDVDLSQYREKALSCMAAPYYYEFRQGEDTYYLSVLDFDGTGEANLKVEYQEENKQAKLTVKDKVFPAASRNPIHRKRGIPF